MPDSRPKHGSCNGRGSCGARRPLASGGTRSGCVGSSARSNGAFLQLAPGPFLGRRDQPTGARTQGMVLSTSDRTLSSWSRRKVGSACALRVDRMRASPAPVAPSVESSSAVPSAARQRAPPVSSVCSWRTASATCSPFSRYTPRVARSRGWRPPWRPKARSGPARPSRFRPCGLPSRARVFAAALASIGAAPR